MYTVSVSLREGVARGEGGFYELRFSAFVVNYHLGGFESFFAAASSAAHRARELLEKLFLFGGSLRKNIWLPIKKAANYTRVHCVEHGRSLTRELLP
jgi:hypothetical protein